MTTTESRPYSPHAPAAGETLSQELHRVLGGPRKRAAFAARHEQPFYKRFAARIAAAVRGVFQTERPSSQARWEELRKEVEDERRQAIRKLRETRQEPD